MRDACPALPPASPTAPAVGALLLAFSLVIGPYGITGYAQASVTRTDIGRLEDALFEAGTDVSQLRTGDAALAQQLRPRLDLLREEVTYLRVSLRKGEPVTWRSYLEVRDGIDDVRRRARGEETLNAAGLGPGVDPPPSAPPTDPVELTRGTTVTVRLLTGVDVRAARDGERVEATVTRAVEAGGRTVVPAGSLMTGVVRRVAPGGQTAVVFEQVVVNYRTYSLTADVVPPPTASRDTSGLAAGTLLTVRLVAPVAIGR